jgi:hypothetical protein
LTVLRGKQIFFLGLAFILLISTGFTAQATVRQNDTVSYKHSLDFFPLSPVIGIYALHYGYRFTAKDQVIVSPSYMRIQYPTIGHTNAPGFIIGYRRYLWKNLHVEYELMPMWDRFYDKNENKTYPTSFDLWNEFRIGYVFDFKIRNIPLFLNLQLPLGFALYSDPKGKSEAFKQNAKENPLFYIPLFFTGIRF